MITKMLSIKRSNHNPLRSQATKNTKLRVLGMTAY